MRYAILLLLFGTLCSCNVKLDKKEQTKNIETDNIFHFILTEGTNFIDSKTGTYTRKYVNDSKSVHFKFTNKEFPGLKDDFLSFSGHFVQPLSIFFDGRMHGWNLKYLPSEGGG